MDCKRLGVSVIIPVYNREKFLKGAIDSILTQNYEGPLEIIISDDGSNDKSIEIARAYKDSRILIVEKPKECKTQGVSGARNRGVLASTQPYICFLDSDDYQLDGFLKKMTIALSSNDICSFVFCRTKQQIEEKGENTLIRMWTKNIVTSLDVKYICLSRIKIVNTNAFLFKREVFDKVGLFNENLTNSEDIDLWLRISEVYKGCFCDFFGSVRRMHDEAQLTKNDKGHIVGCQLEVYNSALRRNENDKDRFRKYLLNYKILLNYKKEYSGIEFKKKHLKLATQYPISFIRHLYLFIIDKIDPFFVKK